MLEQRESEVVSHVDPDLLVRWTQELVQIDSVPRPGRTDVETEAARWVEARCKELGLETTWQWAAPGRPNVIALHRGHVGGRRLMFEGHTDVVTEGNPSTWTVDPFGGTVDNGRIYGRGACDMKGGLVAALGAIHAIVQSGIHLEGDILLGALADEEGLMLGVKDFVEQGWAEDVTAAIICEPEDNRLCIAQKGVVWINLTTRGQMAHGAMPYTGVNPISHMARLLAECAQLEQEYVSRYGEDELLGVPSISPTRVHAPADEHGTNNVIPDACYATLDIRLLPDQAPDAVVADVKALAQRLCAEVEAFDYDITVVDARPATATPREAPIVQALAGAKRDLTGRDPVYGGVPGSTDGTILATHAGVPIVTCGPGNTFVPHQVDEYLDIGQLIEAAKLYVLAALRYLRIVP